MPTPKCAYNYDQLRNVHPPPRLPGPPGIDLAPCDYIFVAGFPNPFQPKESGIEGFFEWQAESTEDDNGGTVIKPKAFKQPNQKGRWHRVFDGAISVKWFGAKGDGVTDDGATITAAAKALQGAGRGVLLFPPGVYRLFSVGQTYGRVAELMNLSGVRVIGYGATLAIDPARVWAMGESASMFHFIACRDVVIEGFTGVGPTPNLASGRYAGVGFVVLEQGTTGVRMPYNDLDGWSDGGLCFRRLIPQPRDT
jgi:hypothetical protein